MFGVDPTLANTDKDNRTDYSEVIAGRRPDVPDMLVKMNFVRLTVDKDAEPGADNGDFKFEWSVVKPDGTSSLVVHSEKCEDPLAPVSHPTVPCPIPEAAENLPTVSDCGDAPAPTTLCWDTKPRPKFNQTLGTVIRINEGASLPFTTDGAGREVNIGSVSTTDVVPEQFGLKGWLEQWNGDLHDILDCRVTVFPDILGPVQDGTGVVKGSDLRPGIISMSIHRTVKCSSGHDLDFTLGVTYTAV
jgi:hypothetical protein